MGAQGQVILCPRCQFEVHFPALSARQEEVMRLLVAGRTAKEIAYQLRVSVKTVDSHRAAILERLNLENLVELVKWAMREGITQ